MNLKAYPIKFCVFGALAVAACAASAQETNLPAPNDFSAFKIISERNIFDPNRVPPRTTPPPPPAIVDSFGLYGTGDDGGNGLIAVFSGSHSEYHKMLETGGNIAGFTVKEIGRDDVKLSSGTNQTDLKVGMQMRRNADGIWTVAELTDLGETSSGAGSRWQSSSHSDRRSNRGNFRNEGRFSSRNSRFGSDMGFQADTGGGMATAPAAGGQMAGDQNPPSEPGNGEPTDPIERMMLRRQQETGGNANANQSETPAEGQSPPPEPPPGNENSTPNQ